MICNMRGMVFAALLKAKVDRQTFATLHPYRYCAAWYVGVLYTEQSALRLPEAWQSVTCMLGL
jgi:hypothetical protein